MRLPIRIKLLLLLLALAQVPLTILIWLDYRMVRGLGTELADQGRAALTERAREQLSQITANYVAIMQHEREILELLVEQQAREVEIRLAAPAPDTVPPVVFDTDIDRGTIALTTRQGPPASTSAADDRDGGAQITFDTQAFRLPPGTGAGQFTEAIARLATMTGVYRRARDRHPDVIIRQYTTLDSGLHSVYPGRGGYPQAYEPRRRPWYLRQKASPGLAWSPPLVDVVTREVTFGVSMPVFGPDGRLAGVTGIDIPVRAFFSSFPLPSGWATESRIFAVTREKDADPAAATLLVLGKQTYESHGRDWNEALAAERLPIDDTGARATLLADMALGYAGIVQARFDGRPALWAYRPFGDSGAFLLLIVPYERAIEHAEAAHAMAIERTRAQLQRTAAFAAAVTLLVVFLALMSARAVTRPVRELAETTRRIAAGDFDARATIHTGDELQQLGEAFNAMVPQLKERLRFSEGINLAREVQQNLIPGNPPQSAHLDIAGTTIYCEETGGDYYDFLDLDHQSPGRIGIAIGDVSGHGISSALVMTTARALLHSYAHQSYPPAQVMKAINDRLVHDVHAGRFMTLFLLIVDTGACTLRWVSAGHDPAILYRPSADQFFELAGQDIPFGVESGWVYNEAERCDWQAGDLVLMATDGVWETRDPAEQAFGKERLKAILREAAHEPARSVCDAVTQALQAYRGGAPQLDDVTVVVVKARIP